MNRILVVDDEIGALTLIGIMLERGGFEILKAQNAHSALSKLEEQDPPDLFILDVMMPVINGFNFCKLLKEQEGHADIPIILLTSRDKMDDVRIGMEVGADAYITKPLNLEELFRAVKLIENKNTSV